MLRSQFKLTQQLARNPLTRGLKTSVPRRISPQPSQPIQPPQPPHQNSQEQQQPGQPETEKPQINPHAAFYKDFGGPLVKVLTITFSTYYGLMYLWEYLDSQESPEKN